jgi:hypothetical protein
MIFYSTELSTIHFKDKITLITLFYESQLEIGHDR